MKKMMVAAALMSMTTAHAQDLSFGDLNYFLKSTQFNLTADVNHSYAEEKNVSQSPRSIGYDIRTRLGYGLSESINLFALVGYNWDREIEDRDGSSHGWNEDGLISPSFGGLWRIMNQGSDRYNIDLGAIANVVVGTAERGISGKDGNAVSPRNFLELNARMGRKWNEANEWQLTVGAIHNFEGEYDQKKVGGGESTVDVDTSTDFYARAAYQYRPVNEFMMSLSVQATRTGEVDVEDAEYDAHIDYDFLFIAKYLVLENFIVRFNYGQSITPDFDVKISGANEEVKRRQRQTMGLGVDWLF